MAAEIVIRGREGKSLDGDTPPGQIIPRVQHRESCPHAPSSAGQRRAELRVPSPQGQTEGCRLSGRCRGSQLGWVVGLAESRALGDLLAARSPEGLGGTGKL